MTRFSRFNFQSGVILGKQGENLARGISIDVSDWITQYGTGTFNIIHCRPGETTPYNATITLSDRVLYWAFSNVDTGKSGRGTAELRYTVDSVLVKSTTFETLIADTLENAGVTPDPYTSWLNTLTGLANTTTANASAAAGSASSAASSASSSASSASSASSSAGDASASATEAAESATTAESAKNNSIIAKTAAEAAQTAAETAETNAKSWAEKSPYVGQNGHWFVYSAEQEDFVDSGVNATGPQGATGATGPQGPQGTAGEGVPSGGTVGQILKKKSGTDYDTEWGNEQDISGLQPKTDNTLATTAKTVVGAVNELKGEIVNKYTKPASGIPASDLASGVIPDISGKVSYTDKLSQITGSLSDAEKATLWSRQTIIKTSMDAVAAAGAQYYLGTQSAVSVTLPSTANAGQEIMVVFYSGATAATLTVSTCLGDVPTPTANQRIELNFLWDGVNWMLLSNSLAVSA